MNQKQEATGPGIVVLSPSLQVLFMNQRAIALLNQLDHTAQSIGTEREISAPLHQHCQDMVETLQTRMRSSNWEQFQQDCTIGNSPHTIVLKGFGLPDRRGLSHSRIMMLLSPHAAQPIPEVSGEESSSIMAHISHPTEPRAYGQ
ncbi:MAG: hypothetical protein EHM80_09200 [Nitrospiraceae bacterium]|nr:MAG: hypothetical protein EHM80_09200 [Nitrospiraceae bacterium]